MAAHLVYAIVVLVCVASQRTASDRLAWISAGLDVAFGAAITLVTEGATSPARVFFAFAVLAVACRSGFRAAVVVTAVSVAVYVGLIFLAPRQTKSLYAMRSFYFAITGYLIGYLAQQRLNFEARVRDFETTTERQGIARSLHDGYVQALAGVSLRLEACRELLRRERPDRALEELTDLQLGVRREYEDVRAYVRSLVDLDRRVAERSSGEDLTLTVDASFRSDVATAEHVLLIMLEGVRNVSRHAGAARASVSARGGDQNLRITIRDDGVGFSEGTGAPWSIASRVAELGGGVQVDGPQSGAHLVIEIPTS